jgi:hypothetical protein
LRGAGFDLLECHEGAVKGGLGGVDAALVRDAGSVRGLRALESVRIWLKNDVTEKGLLTFAAATTSGLPQSHLEIILNMPIW